MSRPTIQKFFLYCTLTLTGLFVNGNQVNKCDAGLRTVISKKSNLLKILSWNIGMLPIPDLFREKEDRANAIAKSLCSTDYDIIVFQEAFTARARSIIYKTLRDQFPYTYGPVNGSWPSFKLNSGIWIMSRIPLTIKKEIEFKASAGFDSFARKGAVLLQGHFNHACFQLIATHLQDDVYPQLIRDSQLSEMYEKLIVPYSDTAIPQIICGDFNTDEKIVRNYREMLTRLNAEDGEISGKIKITFDDESNDINKLSQRDPRLLDYILTRNPHLIEWISRKVAVLKSKWGNGREYLSDHHGIEASIAFLEPDYLISAYKN